jgi:hypothetical protein
MTYSAFILKLRAELKDRDRIARDRWDGNASDTLFQTTHAPIKDASYTFKIGGAAKTETTDYALDKDIGLITAVTPPADGSDNVELTYKYLILRDADYQEVINDAIDHFQWKFWKEAIDETTLTTVKDQYEYSLAGISTNILHIVNVWYKTSSGSTDWIEVKALTNYRYSPRRNMLMVNPTFDVTGLPIKIRYLTSFTKSDTGSATLDIPTIWLTPYKYFCYAKFYERLVPEKISEVGAVTTIPGFLPGPNIINVAEYFYKKAEEAANKIAPKLPPITIPTSQLGVDM